MLTIETRKHRIDGLMDNNKDKMKEEGECCVGSDVMVNI
jgi:hypothetical protein